MKLQLRPKPAADPGTASWALAVVVLFVAYAVGTLVSIDGRRITDSHLTERWTSVHDKISCVQAMYPVHLTFCWITFLAGLAAIAFRLTSYYVDFAYWNQAHMWAGRSYLLGMLWTIATSSLIRNEGLPLGTLVSFLWVLGGLSFGYVLIKLDNRNRWARITHGALMVTSWIGIAGRIFNYNTHKDFKCYTYPVYKANATMLNASDPSYSNMPWADKEVWGWGLPLVVGPFLGTLGLAWLTVP